MIRKRAYAACGVALSVLLGGCANGDFGRVKPSLVDDDIHDWVGRQAARQSGYAPSTANLTDDERALRDLAYPLIEPPYNRSKWDSVLYESGAAPTRGPWWPRVDQGAYGRRLMGSSFRSPEARYSQLIDDVRNDSTRIDQFISVARRVIDMDGKRKRAMAYVATLSDRQQSNAQRRIVENAVIVTWVNQSLRERAASYQQALEQVVIDTPSPRAVEAERALNLLRQQIAAAQPG